MLALVERTEPGPFGPRRSSLGDYFGIRDGEGALVAMAGERMFPSPYREISAVCTDESHRGQGPRGVLVRHLSPASDDAARRRCCTPATTTRNAIRLYEHLGFTYSNLIAVTGYRAPLTRISADQVAL